MRRLMLVFACLIIPVVFLVALVHIAPAASDLAITADPAEALSTLADSAESAPPTPQLSDADLTAMTAIKQASQPPDKTYWLPPRHEQARPPNHNAPATTNRPISSPRMVLPARPPAPSRPPALVERPPVNAARPSAAYSNTLQPIHRNISPIGLSSAFVYTNTGSAESPYFLNFYWLNGQFFRSEGPVTLTVGASAAYDLATAPWGETFFSGRVDILGDQPVNAAITTADSGMITGVIYETDGVTPLPGPSASLYGYPNQGGYGGIYNLSDGRYYLGGLPPGNYSLMIGPGYPWANQWYNNTFYHSEADPIAVGGPGSVVTIDVALQPGGLITGVVYAADGVTPLEHVNVDLEEGHHGSCTDADGRYTIYGATYGDNFVRAGGGWNWCLNRNSEYSVEYYQESADFAGATAIILGAEQDIVANINFTLEEGGTITGTVYTDDGVTPLADEHIELQHLDGSWAGNGCTDADGHYAISGLAPGSYRISAGGGWNWCLNQNSLYVTEYWQETWDWNAATPIEITSPGQVVPGIDFTLDLGGSVAGAVYEEDGVTPLVNVNVNISSYEDGRWNGGACTDADGHYVINGVPLGSYRVSAGGGWNWCAGEQSYTIQEFYNETWWHHLATPVEVVTPGQTISDINFSLSYGALVSGTVYAADGVTPLPNVNVNLNEDRGYGTGSCTDDQGHYLLGAAPAGQYRVGAGEGWNYCLNQPTAYVREYWQETPDPNAATLLDLSIPFTLTGGIDFTLEPGGYITGRVLAADSGLPLAGVHVNANEFDSGWYWSDGWTDDGGNYIIGGLIEEIYRVEVTDSNSIPAGYASQYYDHARYWQEATPVAVTAGVTTPDINFDLEPGGSISGVVLDEVTGLPLANINVQADMLGGGGGSGTCSSSDGSFTINGLFFGDYQVSAARDWNWCLGQPNEHVAQWYDHVPFDWLATPVTVEAGNPFVGGIGFDLAHGGYIAGIITDEGGQPVSDVSMYACVYQPQWDWLDCRVAGNTGPDGSYVLGPLAVGYSFYVQACPNCSGRLFVNSYYPGVFRWSDATTLTAAEGETLTGIDMVLVQGIWLTGQVSVPEGFSAESIHIDAWEQIPYGYGGWAQTDADGNYIIPVPPFFDSRWNVSAHPWGTNLSVQQAGNFDLWAQTNWDFNLGPEATISGRVTLDGQPVAYVQVDAQGNWIGNGDQTDADGYFTITNLPPGDFRLGLNGWPDYFSGYYGGFDWSSARVLHVEEGQNIVGLEFPIARLGVLDGTIYASDGLTPLEGIAVSAINPDGYFTGWTQTDGSYRIYLPVGDYKVMARDESGAGGWARLFYPDSYSYGNAMTVTVTAGKTPTAADMALPHSGAVAGQVTDASSGEPLGGILISALNIDPQVGQEKGQATCTDEFGNYSLSDLWPGQTQVTASGICGNVGYGAAVSVVQIQEYLTASADFALVPNATPPRPFTVRLNDAWDYTPLASANGFMPNDADQILPALFAPLVELDDGGNWYADLATEVPTPDNGRVAIQGDQLVVTYTLKSGLLWSDGVVLDSADFRFAWQLLTQPTPYRDNYTVEWGEMFFIEDVATPDPQTVVVRFLPGHFPPAYLTALTYPLPEHILAGEHWLDLWTYSHFAHYPVGNGPYVVKEWVAGSHLDLQTNLTYHRRGEGLPRIGEMRLLLTDDPFYAAAHGRAEVALQVPVGNLPEDYLTYGLVEYVSTGSGFSSLIPNPARKSFFGDQAVRQALSHALDRERFIHEYMGRTALGQSWLPPDHPLYSDTVTNYPFDLALAAALLDAAGWVDSNGNGLRDQGGVEMEFDLYVNEAVPYVAGLAAVFGQDLASIGVDANVVTLPWNELYDRLRHGYLDVTLQGWIFDNRYDPFGWAMLHSDALPSGYNGFNTPAPLSGWWDDPINDALLAAAHTELDAAALRDLYAQQIALFSQATPSWIIANYNRRLDFTVPTLLNFRPSENTPATWNIAQWQMPVNPYDLSLRKALAADSPAPQPDSDIIYQITVQNLGFFTVTGATLVDVLPPEVVFVSADPMPDDINGSALTWQLGDLPVGAGLPPIRITVHIPADVAHGVSLTNQAAVFGDQDDTWPGNNGFVFTVTVRDDVDLAMSKFGVGLPAVGEQFEYILDYANWGGAPATDVILTDTLPAEMIFVSADPPPDSISGSQLSWNVGDLPGGAWAGQITIQAEIDATGVVVNTAQIAYAGPETDLGNNEDDHTESVDDILPPLLIRPNGGATNGEPTFAGWSPANALVKLYDLTGGTPFLLGSTTAGTDGQWSLELALAEDTYTVVATATKAGLTSSYSNSASIVVDHDIVLDTDLVAVTANGVDIARGVVRAERRTMAHRQLFIETVLACPTEPTANLAVTENGLVHYDLLPLSITNIGGDQWQTVFNFYLGAPHNTFDIWLHWNCQGAEDDELLVYILIDPDGYVYDQAMVDAGSAITDSLVTTAVITAYAWLDDAWQVWPAALYGQSNPQVSDGSADDGVIVAGYYSFLTPPGRYRIEAAAPGYQPFLSAVLTVIDTPIHLDVGLQPIQGGGGQSQSPVNLSASTMESSLDKAWVGDTLTTKTWLVNSGEADAGPLTTTIPIPAWTDYVPGSLVWSEGDAGYDALAGVIWWLTAPGGGTAQYVEFELRVTASPGWPFDVVRTAVVSGAPTDLLTMPPLSVSTLILNEPGFAFEADEAQNGDPGQAVAYLHSLHNSGNAVDTFTFSAVSSQEWTVALPEPLTLAPDETVDVWVTVSAPADAPAGLVDQTTVTVSSSVVPSLPGSVLDTTTVNQVAALNISQAAPQEAKPGAVVAFVHTLSNLGNGVDTFTVAAVSAHGWDVIGGGEITLAAGASAEIEIWVTVPGNASDGLVDITTLTVTSHADPSAMATAEDEIAVEHTRLYLPVIKKQPAAGVQGHTIGRK